MRAPSATFEYMLYQALLGAWQPDDPAFLARMQAYALKAALSPEVPNNTGSFRPVGVSAPEGCILNCQRPSAVSARHIVGHFVPSLIFRALAEALPERVAELVP